MGQIPTLGRPLRWYSGKMFLKSAKGYLDKIEKTNNCTWVNLAALLKVRMDIVRGIRVLFSLSPDPLPEEEHHFPIIKIFSASKKYLDKNVFEQFRKHIFYKANHSYEYDPYGWHYAKIRNNVTGKEHKEDGMSENPKTQKMQQLLNATVKERFESLKIALTLAQEIFCDFLIEETKGSGTTDDIHMSWWFNDTEMLIESGMAKDENKTDKILSGNSPKKFKRLEREASSELKGILMEGFWEDDEITQIQEYFCD